MGKTLKDYRLSKNKTQLDMAKAVGISESYYNLIENGNRMPAIDIANLIAKELGLSLDQFFLLCNLTKCNDK